MHTSLYKLLTVCLLLSGSGDAASSVQAFSQSTTTLTKTASPTLVWTTPSGRGGTKVPYSQSFTAYFVTINNPLSGSVGLGTLKGSVGDSRQYPLTEVHEETDSANTTTRLPLLKQGFVTDSLGKLQPESWATVVAMGGGSIWLGASITQESIDTTGWTLSTVSVKSSTSTSTPAAAATATTSKTTSKTTTPAAAATTSTSTTSSSTPGVVATNTAATSSSSTVGVVATNTAATSSSTAGVVATNTAATSSSTGGVVATNTAATASSTAGVVATNTAATSASTAGVVATNTAATASTGAATNTAATATAKTTAATTAAAAAAAAAAQQ